jgi:sugar lactone lactonase YvrE
LHRLAILSAYASLSVLVAGCSANVGTLPGPHGSASSGPAEYATGHPRSAPLLYVSNLGGSVLVYSTGSNPTLLQTITDGVPRPGAVWVDKHGVLYAVNLPDSSYQTSLPEYKPGASKPFSTITNGIVNCDSVAVDSRGNVYVAGKSTKDGSLFLEIYPKGKLSPAETLTIPSPGLSAVDDMTFDSSGALLVGEEPILGSTGGLVYRLAPGSQMFTQINLENAPGGIIAVDKHDNLYAAGDSEIFGYRAGKSEPFRRLSDTNYVDAMSFDSAGNLYVGGENGNVSVFGPKGKQPTQSFYTQAFITGVALSR